MEGVENCELSSECLWCSADTNSVKIKITEKIQQNLISAVDIPELMRWLLTLNPEEDKALEHTLNTDKPFKDRSRKRLRRLEIKKPLGSELVSRLESLRKFCRIYISEKLNSHERYSSSRDIFKHFHQQLSLQKQKQYHCSVGQKIPLFS